MSKQYCSACGAKLVIKKERLGYDPDTGKHLYHEELICPKSAAAKGWWKFWLTLKDHTGDDWGYM